MKCFIYFNIFISRFSCSRLSHYSTLYRTYPLSFFLYIIKYLNLTALRIFLFYLEEKEKKTEKITVKNQSSSSSSKKKFVYSWYNVSKYKNKKAIDVENVLLLSLIYIVYALHTCIHVREMRIQFSSGRLVVTAIRYFLAFLPPHLFTEGYKRLNRLFFDFPYFLLHKFKYNIMVNIFNGLERYVPASSRNLFLYSMPPYCGVCHCHILISSPTFSAQFCVNKARFIL